MLLRKEAIQRHIFNSMVEISKAKFLPRPIGNLELGRGARGGIGGGGCLVDVAEGEAVGEWHGGGDGGVEVGEVEQALLEEAEEGRRDVAEVEEEAEQRHGR